VLSLKFTHPFSNLELLIKDHQKDLIDPDAVNKEQSHLSRQMKNILEPHFLWMCTSIKCHMIVGNTQWQTLNTDLNEYLLSMRVTDSVFHSFISREFT
jgi:hypothetical protein